MAQPVRSVAVLLTAFVMLGGCATGSERIRAASDSGGMATPGPDLVGTWRGMAWAVPGSLYLTNTPVELTISPDGTWKRTRRGEPQASGRLRIAGDRVVLEEETSKDVEQRIELKRTGIHLWGLSEAFIPGAISAVDLERVS